MKIRHPFSFVLLMIVLVGSASLSVVWSAAHMLAVVIILLLIVLLRQVAMWEGQGLGWRGTVRMIGVSVWRSMAATWSRVAQRVRS